jgi:uroporphyrinogen III methyltransferase/synthase
MRPDREELPLKGKRIVVTRARPQARVLTREIERLGGEPVDFPTIEIRPPQTYSALDGAIEKLDTYEWVFFTSVNGVEYFLRRLGQHKREFKSRPQLKVVAIGPETASRLEAAGITPYLVPKRYQAEAILDGLTPEAIRGKRVLIPRAAQAREVLPETLRKWGGDVDVVEAYETALPKVDTSKLRAMFHEGKIDMITFTSSSTASHFVQLFSGENLGELIGRAAIACIGPITSKTVEDLGLRADVVAEEYTIPGLVQAIVAYFTAISRVPSPSPLPSPASGRGNG